jgi:hypothetical protein
MLQRLSEKVRQWLRKTTTIKNYRQQESREGELEAVAA